MKNRMRLLIAHDGTNRIDETLGDLRRAGLPRDAMARALSAVQVMAPTPETMIGINQTFTLLESEVEETVKQYCRRLREIFPESAASLQQSQRRRRARSKLYALTKWRLAPKSCAAKI